MLTCDMPQAEPSGNLPLEGWEIEQLATFNAEVARGLVHTDVWRARMARLQARFDFVGYIDSKGKRVAR